MKEQRIKIIVAVMTLSVAALIALQIYWINSMIKIEEERFERTVNTALLSVSGKLEKQEVAHTIVKRITGGRNNVAVFVKNDSIPNDKPFNKKTPVRVVHFDSSGKNNLGYRITYSSDSKPGTQKVEIFESHLSKSQKPPFNYSWNKKTDTLVFKRDQLVQNVVTELVSENTFKRIEERISKKQLDSLLSYELKNSGVNTEFYFAVNKTEENKLTLIKPGADTAQLKNTDLRTALFPAEMFFNPNQLVVYFPNKKTYIFSSVGGMIVLSVGLILIIAGVFFKTLQLFIKQKKITEIKNDLINNITHEFKTPISTIAVACEALNEPSLTKDSTSIAKYSSIILEENSRLKMMVDNILAAAAFEVNTSNGSNGSLQLSKENISLDEIINESLGKFEETLKQKNGKVVLDGIPSGIIINADKFHFANLLINLIDNAIKYNEHTPEIVIQVRSKDGTAIIKVSDNGIGIAKENHKKIFDAFYRVPTGNIHNVRGNGIGLSYVKKIIEEHDGEIWVQSVLREGSTFEIKIRIIG